MKRYYPWLMALTGLLIMLVSNGMTAPGITVFDDKLLNFFGWTRGELKMRGLITLVLTGCMGPFMGIIVDRLGPRRLILFGIAMLTAMYVAYGFVSNLTELYLIHFGFAMVLITAGLPVTVIFVSKWFHRQRGAALGIALVGVSLGGMVFPSIGTRLLQHMDWRNAFIWEAVIPAAALVLFFFIVRTPRAGGIEPWGADSEPKKASSDKLSAAGMPDINFKQALRTRTFWALVCISIATFYAIMAIAQNLFLHMRGFGYDPVQAGNALALMFGVALVSKLIFGPLADILSVKIVFLFELLVMMAGAVTLATMSEGVIWYSLVLIGMGWGGLYPLIQLLAVNTFGLSSAGKILGTITFFDATAAGIGIWTTAKIYDVTGSYALAFEIIAGLLVIAFIAATLVRNERARITTQAA